MTQEEADGYDILTCWIPFTKATRENGALRILKNVAESRDLVIGHHEDERISELWPGGEPVDCLLNRGDAVFISAYDLLAKLNTLERTIAAASRCGFVIVFRTVPTLVRCSGIHHIVARSTQATQFVGAWTCASSKQARLPVALPIPRLCYSPGQIPAACKIRSMNGASAGLKALRMCVVANSRTDTARVEYIYFPGGNL